MRLLAGSLAPAILLSRFPAGHAAIWEDSFAPSLHLMPCLLAAVDPGVRVDLPSAAQAETSLRLVVEVAVHSEELETACVVLILGHAAYAPDHSGLCLWALELLAAMMGYDSRQQYLAYHMQVSRGADCGGRAVREAAMMGYDSRQQYLAYHMQVGKGPVKLPCRAPTCLMAQIHWP